MATEVQVALKFLRTFRSDHFDQCKDEECSLCQMYAEAIGMEWEQVLAIRQGGLVE